MNQAFQNFVGSLQGNKMASPFAGGSTSYQSPFSGALTKPAQVTPSSPSAVSPATTPVSAKPAAAAPSTARAAFTESLKPSSPAPAATTPSQTASPGASPVAAPAAPAASPVEAYAGAYKDALAKYTASLAPSDKTASAATSLADIQNKIDQDSLDAKNAYQAQLDQPGMLKAGAQNAATLLDRRNNANLAQEAVKEGAAARTLLAYQGADTARQTGAKNVIDASKPLQVGSDYFDPITGKKIGSSKDGAFTLGAGQSRYDENGKLVAGAGSNGSSFVNGVYTAGQNPTVDAWANRIQNGSAKISDIPASQASLRNEVTKALDAMGNSTEGKPTTTELGKQALTTAQGLLQKFDAGKGTSAVGKSGALNSFGYGFIPGTDRANFVTDFNSLKSQLALEGVKYLKGQGSVSDAERALLSAAVTKLNLTQSEDEFKTTLQGIIDRLSGNAPKADDKTQEQGIVVTAPDRSAHSFPDQKSADAFKKAANIQ